METILLAKARNSLQATKLLLEHDLNDDSVSRAYYAAFQAALAMLSTVGVEVEGISHQAAQSTFNKELIHRRKTFPRKFRSYLLYLHEKRLQADYRTSSVSGKVASRQIQKAEELVQRVEQELSK